MISVGIEVFGGQRMLFPGINPALNIIAELKPKIFGIVCVPSPKQFVGSVLLEADKDFNTAVIAESPFKVAQSIKEPLIIAKDIPLSLHFKGEGYRELDLKAERVLIKKSPGMLLGLVLSGDLAGILLQPENGLSFENGMCVNRVWNDFQASFTEVPYYPNLYLDDPELLRNPIFFAQTEAVRKVVVGGFKENYRAEIWQAEQELGRMPSERELLFRLCQRVGVEVDVDNFHYTTEKIDAHIPSKQGKINIPSLTIENN